MTHSANIAIPVDPPPTKTEPPTSFILNFLKFVGRLLTLAATVIRAGVMTPLGHLWARFYPLVALVEERIVIPPSGLNFIITVLLAFVGIKAQGQPEFPFKTHPHHVCFSITSVLVFGLAYAIELIVSAAVQTQKALRT